LFDIFYDIRGINMIRLCYVCFLQRICKEASER
jgi:hypothetical protein